MLAVVRNICLDQIRKTNRHPEVIKISPAIDNAEGSSEQIAEIADSSLSVEEEV